MRLLESAERIGVSTIYRVLVDMKKAGLVTRHQFDQGSVSRSVYELSFGEPHDHMVCIDTDTVIEFRDPVIEKRQREIAEAHGCPHKSIFCVAIQDSSCCSPLNYRPQTPVHHRRMLAQILAHDSPKEILKVKAGMI